MEGEGVQVGHRIFFANALYKLTRGLWGTVNFLFLLNKHMDGGMTYMTLDILSFGLCCWGQPDGLRIIQRGMIYT
jgi:hypothetical protein